MDPRATRAAIARVSPLNLSASRSVLVLFLLERSAPLPLTAAVHRAHAWCAQLTIPDGFVMGTTNKSAEFKARFPLGKVFTARLIVAFAVRTT